jgi:TolB protein
MNADGSQPRAVTSLRDTENNPSFSPDGGKIAFSLTNASGSQLMVVNVDGTGLRVLKSAGHHDWTPDWGRGGIVFSSNRESPMTWRLWKVQPDGTGLTRINDVAGHDPVWSNDGRIFYTDEAPDSRSTARVATLNPADGTRTVVVDVEGRSAPARTETNRRCTADVNR